MKAATIAEIKKELKLRNPSEVMDICFRLARFKSDNKELITYMLFEASNEGAYIQSVKNKVAQQMSEINRTSIYYTKKGLRKVLRQLDKNIRYSGKKETEVELRMDFCRQIKAAKIPLYRSQVLRNMYQRQIKKIETAMSKLHEDLQYDYSVELEDLK